MVNAWKLPTLVLGGGGYNHPNTARLNAHLVAALVGKQLPVYIPDEYLYYELFKPDFQTGIRESLEEDLNTEEELQKIESYIYNLVQSW